jgi:Family of unknown function (DUF5681)
VTRSYEVGYGKPPLATRFKKGASGNPKGRKRGSRNLASLVTAALDEHVVVNVNGRRRTVSKLEAAFIQQANKAATGDPKATKLMVDLMIAAQAREAAAEPADAVKFDTERDRAILEALRARVSEDGEPDDGG